MLIHTLVMKSRERMALDIFYIFDAYFNLFIITDVDCWTCSSNTHGCVFGTFTYNRTRN